MDKTLLELADECQSLVAKIEAHLKVARTESETNCERLGRECDRAESDESMSAEAFAVLADTENKASKRDDHIVAAHDAALTALNSIIDVWIHAKEIQ